MKSQYAKWGFYFLGFVIPILLLSHPSFALKTDNNQATKLSSDKADFNDVTQEYILTGNVNIVKGSIVIKGEKAVVIIDPEGFQQITVIGNQNKLASFTQQLDKPSPEFIDGEGDLIFYEAKKDQLLLSGNAYTVRRKGQRWTDKLVSDEIQYDLYIEQYKAVSKNMQKPTRSVLAPKETPQTALKNTK
jgi:lipopolysaccharide export system protein LptA